MKKVVINEEQKKELKKAIAAQDQVGGKVNAGIMDAVCGVGGMCEVKNDEGKNVPEKCDKCGGEVVLQIHGEPVYVCKECGKYFGTMPFDLEENMEEKSEYELGFKKDGNSLPPDMHVINEGKETKFNYEPYMKSLADFMVDYGLKILPYPDVTLINHNDDGVFVPTGNYSPDEKRIRVYTIGRHPKDVLRTFAHEMIHHMQNLRGDTDWGHGGDLEEDAILEQIEGEAYLLGNLVFRKWTEHIQHRTGGATVLKEGKELELDELTSDEVDLSSFQVKDQLNPYFWKDGHLDSRVRMKLLDISDDFVETLGLDTDEIEDVIMTGSLANFNWSEEYSDIDLHVVVDYGLFAGSPEMLKDYFDAKRKLWNDIHKELKIYGFPVELYVQDKSEIHASTGVYSIDRDKWLVEPNKSNFDMGDVNDDFVKDVVAQITQQVDSLYDLLDDSDDEYKDRKVGELAKELFDIIKLERRNSLKNSNKEMVDGNIIFKTLRRNGYIEKLVNLINRSYDKTNSI